MLITTQIHPNPRRLIALLVLAVLLVVALPAQAQGSPAVIGVEPRNDQPGPGESYNVAIVLENAFEVYAIDVQMRFDPALVEVIDVNPRLDGVQILQGDFPKPDFTVFYSADNELGTISYVVTQTNPTPPASGSGTVFTVQLLAKGSEPATLTFDKVEIANRDGFLLDVTTEDGQLTWEPVARQPTSTPILVQPTNVPQEPLTGAVAPAPTDAAPPTSTSNSTARESLPASAPATPAPLPTLAAAPAVSGNNPTAAPPSATLAGSVDHPATLPANTGSLAENVPTEATRPAGQELDAAAGAEAAQKITALDGDQQPPADEEPADSTLHIVGEAQQPPSGAVQQSSDAAAADARQGADDSDVRILIIVALLVLVVAALALVLLLIRRSSTQ